MKILLSPAKSMNRFEDFAGGRSELPPAESPAFGRQARKLNSILKMMSGDELTALFKCSQSKLNEIRYNLDHFHCATPIPAACAYNGEAFKALNAISFDDRDWDFAQRNLRIFSGIYGLLTPCSGIVPSRLDMNDSLKPEGYSLKRFWKEDINRFLTEELSPGEAVINLASAEYSSILNLPADHPVYTLEFRVNDEGKLKNMSVFSKQARGLFAREIICRKISSPDQIQSIKSSGWSFRPALSSPDRMFFVRDRN